MIEIIGFLLCLVMAALIISIAILYDIYQRIKK